MPAILKITSLTNPAVKKVVRLREHHERLATGLMVIDGAREVERALKMGIDVQEIYFCREYLEKKDVGFLKELHKIHSRVMEVGPKVFSKMAYGDRQDGLLVVARKPQTSLTDFKFKEKALLVILENVEKPGNLGAVLRSCDGAGVDGVIVCDGQTDVYNPNAIRASLGTIFSVKVIQSTNDATLEFLKKNGFKIFATLAKAPVIYSKADFGKRSAIILGSEDKGLSEFWVKHSDVQLKIPMHGIADSLNVSTTAAVLVYEAIRQRNNFSEDGGVKGAARQ